MNIVGAILYGCPEMILNHRLKNEYNGLTESTDFKKRSTRIDDEDKVFFKKLYPRRFNPFIALIRCTQCVNPIFDVPKKLLFD